MLDVMGPWLLVASGLVALVLGAEWLVRGSSALALRLGLSPLVIGLTVVAFGTSSPEVAVSLSAVAQDKPDLALGNIVGSNIFNVLFILGLAALVSPLVVDQKLVRVDAPIMLAGSLGFWLLLADGRLGRFDGLLLLGGLVTYTTFAILASRRESKRVRVEYDEATRAEPRGSLWRGLALAAVGLAVLVVGARWLVDGAVDIARGLGVSELVIGATIVAAGTPLPELATSVVAAVRGQRDIAVGNVVGSNIFNIGGIAGLAGVWAPEGLPAATALMAFDLPVMVAAAAACLPIVTTGFRVNRWEGAAFIAGYAAYVLAIVTQGSDDGLAGLRGLLPWFVVPGVLFVLGMKCWGTLTPVEKVARKRHSKSGKSLRIKRGRV